MSSILMVPHQPSPMAGGVPAYAIGLAERARSHGRVAIYAGAGISVSQPTGLPTGASLAQVIHATLRTAFPSLDGVDPADLTAVADAVASLAGGGEALRETAARSAEFRTATPSYGHRMIANLLLEGVIDVLTTNWDDCIERGGMPERIQAVTDERSLARVTPPSVLKVHGCASEPSSLLVTTDELQNPPRWAREQTHARLGSAVVVFVGIGDVAGYVKQRIAEAIDDVGNIGNIRVVSPSIVERWEDSQWAAVAPNVAGADRIAATSDEFMEQLGAAYIHVSLNTHVSALAGDPRVAPHIQATVDGLLTTDALSLLEWVRRSAVAPHQGESVLNAGTMAEALTALGRLAGTDLSLKQGQVFNTSEGPIEILVATHGMSARRMEQEAENRLHGYAARGQQSPRFLVAGGIGWVKPSGALPSDVLHESDSADIVDGPHALVPDILLAHEVLAS
jgi:hypothetical protein